MFTFYSQYRLLFAIFLLRLLRLRLLRLLLRLFSARFAFRAVRSVVFFSKREWGETGGEFVSYLKKKSCENAREWKLRIWDPKQKTNFARELDTSPPSLSPPRARVDWGSRARVWEVLKSHGCTHTPHKSFAGTQSGKIRAFYIVSLSVYFLRRKKRKTTGKNWGKGKRNLYLVSKKRIFFFISSSLSRARICAHLRAHIISLFFCVRARTRARKSHALLSSIEVYRW